jgi:glucose/arabinose dehydrogenase
VRRGVAVAVALLAAAGACKSVKEEPSATTLEVPSTTLVPVSTTSTTLEPLPDLGAVSVELDEVAVVDQPTAIAVRAGDPAIYVAERPGRIRRVEITTATRRRSGSTTPVTTQTFQLERSAVLDLSDGVEAGGQEQGLIGLTFSTDGNRLYVAYTGTDGAQHLDEYEMEAERPDEGSRREILVIPDFANNHNGGGLAFGPDGYLYWSMGDGGGAGDPEDTGQDPSDLLGSILRIDTDVLDDAPAPYAVPDGNPFAEGGGAPEVWAYGLRNPWRFSFDLDTGDLWIADVGQGDVEEIDLLPATEGQGAGRGSNLGWPAVEGDRGFDEDEPPEGAVAPILTYDHGDGRCSVTGGFVYRGERIGGLNGAYLFGDYCEGQLRALVHRDGEVEDNRELGLEVPQLSTFGQDAEGELYVASLEGPVYRLVPTGS